MNDAIDFAFEVIPMAENHIRGFWAAVVEVSRESRNLASLEGPTFEMSRAFVLEGLRDNRPHFIALHDSTVIGWCDISPSRWALHAHVGVLGMGVVAGFRGHGVGRALIGATIDKAKAIGLTRIELLVREENKPAIALYEHVGFVVEGLKRKSTRLDGHYYNDLLMALLP